MIWLYFDNPQMVFDFVASRMRSGQWNWTSKNTVGIGLCREEDNVSVLAGGIILEAKSPYDVHFTIAVDDPHVVTRKVIKCIADIIFGGDVFGLDVARCTALVHPKNKQSRKSVQRLGFKEEGCLRKGFDGKSNAIIYGMLKEECIWLKESFNGLTPVTA